MIISEKELSSLWNIVATLYSQFNVILPSYATITFSMEAQSWTSEGTALMWKSWVSIQLRSM